MRRWFKFNAFLTLIIGLSITIVIIGILVYTGLSLTFDDNWFLFTVLAFGILLILCSHAFWHLEWLWVLLIYQLLIVLFGVGIFFFFAFSIPNQKLSLVLGINHTIKEYGIYVGMLIACTFFVMLIISIIGVLKAKKK